MKQVSATQKAWWFTVAAGLLEIVWTTGLKSFSDQVSALKMGQPDTNLWTASLALVATVAAIVASFDVLTRATKVLPVGTVYAAFTGIGSAGAVAVGAIVFGEPLSLLKVLLIGLLVLCIIGLKQTENRPAAGQQQR
ncbi:MAG TPA: SMR family transporter [Symbiobacteriaceae bacterium]